MFILTHIKEDWRVRLPYRLYRNPYKRMSKPCYALLCLMYYAVKDVGLILFYLYFRFLKLIAWDVWKWLYYRFFPYSIESIEDNEEEDCLDEPADELSFCQLFQVSDKMSLLIDHIEMCPDETAFIRVVDDEGYTPLYKRKVRRDKAGNRFIVFSGTNYYLDPAKTQPVTLGK